jgi:glycosyltransferase involved in cell wall biosynthesis
MEIIKNTNIGIAPYKPEPGNVSYYGDPSKIKNYLSFGLPVITTNVFEFSEIIRTSGAGEIIPYKLEPFLNSIQKIISNYGQYSVLARSLAQKYYYAKYYDKMFA